MLLFFFSGGRLAKWPRESVSRKPRVQILMQAQTEFHVMLPGSVSSVNVHGGTERAGQTELAS